MLHKGVLFILLKFKYYFFNSFEYLKTKTKMVDLLIYLNLIN